MGTASGGTSPLSFKRLGVAGIANSTLGSLLTAIGLLLQQRSTRVSKDRVGLARFRSLEYTMGVTLVAAGGISALVGEGILPLSTLAPLATQTVIFKAIGGKVLLGETISIQKWIAMALIFTGLVVSMIGANLEDAHYDLQHLLYLFEQPQAMFYTAWPSCPASLLPFLFPALSPRNTSLPSVSGRCGHVSVLHATHHSPLLLR